MSVRCIRAYVAAMAGLGGVLTCAAGALAQPSNDTCAQAQVVPLADPYVQVFGDTFAATSDIATGGCAGGDATDVWYTFTAVRAGSYGITTIGTNPPPGFGFDTSIAVYASCGNLTVAGRLGCNDDISVVPEWLDARVSVTLAAGQAVLVRVAGVGGATVQGAFTLTIGPPALNDSCANAETIVLDQPAAGTNIGATDSFRLLNPSSLCGNGASGSWGRKDVFYAFTPTLAGPNPYRISLCPSNPDFGFDSNLAVLTACPAGTTVGSPTVIACNEDVLPGATCYDPSNFVWTPEIQTVSLTGGVRYLIRVAGYDYCAFLNPALCGTNPNEGLFTLFVTSAAAPPAAPANDTCATAAVVSTLPYSSGAIAIGGAGDDVDVGCNAPASTTTRGGVWFSYTPAAACTLSITQSDPTTAAVIAVFTGPCASPTQVLCAGNGFVNENPTLSVQAGVTYRILVGRYEASTASPADQVNVGIDCVTPVANDACAQAETIVVDQTVFGTTATATSVGDGPGGTCGSTSVSVGKAVWYRFTPSSGGLYTFDGCSSASNIDLQLFTIGSCADSATWSQVACDLDSCGQPGLGGRIQDVALSAGVSYVLRVGAFRPALLTTPNGGAFQITLTGTAGSTAVCCRGATCAVVANAGDCTAPAGVGVRVLDASVGSCDGQAAVNSGCCYADFNKSGVKDVADIFAYLSAWFANSPFADVGGDGTGTRDVSDIFQFLSAWFVGCS